MILSRAIIGTPIAISIAIRMHSVRGAVPCEEVEVAVVGDVALDISALAHPVHRVPVDRCFAPVGSPPGRLLLSGHPLMRVASNEIANG